MALPAPSLALWQDPGYSTYYLAMIHNPAIVFQARIDPSAPVTYPASVLHFYNVTTGAYTDLKEEMLLLVGSSAGADDYGRQRVHGNDSGTVASSVHINIGRSSQGTRDGELNLVSDAYVTVLNLRPLWAAPPWIDTDEDPGNPTTFKDGVLTFNVTTCFRPVVNLGVDRLRVVETALDTADFIFTVTAYATHPSAVGTPTVLWDIADGTLIAGTLTSTTITVRYGVTDHHRYIGCTATDSLATTQNGWRLVAVADKNHADLISKFNINRWRQGIDGQDMQLKVDSAIPYSTYPDGTEILLAQRERYNFATVGSLTGYTDAENMVFAGWLQSEQNTGEAGKRGFIGRTVLTLVDGVGRLKTLPGFPQTVERKTVPTVWTDMQSANIDRYIFYILKWHSNTLTRVDFTWSGTGETYAFPTLGSDGGSLYDQADKRCQAITYRLTCNKNGQLAMKADPMLQPTAAQASQYSLPAARTTTVVVPISEADWMNYSYNYTRPPRVHWNRGETIAVSTEDADSLTDIGTFFAVAPGLAPGQGLSGEVSGQQLAISQGELNVREGNRYAARMNAREGYFEVQIRPGDVIDPANMVWVQFTISSTTAGPRGRTYASERFLPIELNHTYNPRKGLRVTKITMEREVSGIPAVLDPQPDQTVTTYPPVVIEPPTTVPVITIPGDGLPSDVNTLALFNIDGYVYLTPDFQNVSPTWTRTDLTALGLGGQMVMFIVDAFSPLYLSTGTTVNGWVVTTTQVRRITDIFGTIALGAVTTLTQTTPYRNMQFERGTPNLGFIASYGTGDGVYVARTTDGVTWTETQVNAFHDTGAPNSYWPGASLNYATGQFLTSAFSAGAPAASLAGVGELTNSGATFVTTALLPATGNGLASDITQPFQDQTTVYYGFNGSSSTDYKLYKTVDGGTPVDVSPVYGGHSYGPFAQFNIKTCDVDKNTVLLVGIYSTLIAHPWTTFYSSDGGATWPTIIANGDIVRGNISGDDPLTLFLWGNNNTILLSTDGGVTQQDKSGNIFGSFGVVGQFLNIAGGG